MIQLPRRSVTRFFIPLIDVLTLLFCIFLLMPVVRGKPEGSGSEPDERRRDADAAAIDPLVADAAELARLLARAQQDLERLRTEKIETLQRRLSIQVLEIDATSGKLFYYDGGSRVELDQRETQQLVDRQKREAGNRELYYLILFPRQVTGYPEERQIVQYERWFQGVAHGFDNPRGRR